MIKIDRPAETSSRALVMLERATAAALALVVFLLAWVLGAAYGPAWLRLPSVEAEVAAALGLLAATLALVSLLALLHTRRPRAGSKG